VPSGEKYHLFSFQVHMDTYLRVSPWFKLSSSEKNPDFSTISFNRVIWDIDFISLVCSWLLKMDNNKWTITKLILLSSRITVKCHFTYKNYAKE
jgi:hypothetical protein